MGASYSSTFFIQGIDILHACVSMLANKRTVQWFQIAGTICSSRHATPIKFNIKKTRNKTQKERGSMNQYSILTPLTNCIQKPTCTIENTHAHSHTHITAMTSCCLVTILDDSTGSNNPTRIWGISAKSLSPCVCPCVRVLWLSDSV